jgi:hypothetical protein
MPLSERIVVDPEILAGKPVIRGTRLAVEFILELLAAGQSESGNLPFNGGFCWNNPASSCFEFIPPEFRCWGLERADGAISITC